MQYTPIVTTAMRLADAAPPPALDVPAWAAKGFRPFFLLAGAFAALIIPLWLVALAGIFRPDGYVEPMLWHAHEMVFGYTAAVIAGFLLTAVSNWTGRATASGGALIALATVWLLGRIAFALAGSLPRGLVAAVDLAFLPLLALVIGRALIASRSRRNYPVLAIVVGLALVNLVIHLDVLGVLPGWSYRASRAAVNVVVLLVLVIAARVIPMFTRNATSVAAIRGHPQLDLATAGAMAVYTLAELVWPGRLVGAVLAGVVASLAVARSIHWGTHHTLRHPLLWILHVGHLAIIVGLGLRAIAPLHVVPASAALHALTVGGIGCITLGMMARVALGHTGRALDVRWPMTVAFAAITLAAAIRVAAPWWPTSYASTLRGSGVLWSLAFAIFVVVYARILTTPRHDGRPG